MRMLLGFLFVAVALAAPPMPAEGRLRVPFWVAAQEDEEPVEIAEQSLSATLNGTDVRIGSMLGPGDDLMLLIVTDLAGDMALVDEAKRSLVEEIQRLPPNTSIGLLRAQDGLRVVVDPTTDRELLTGAIVSLPVSGRAGLLDTVASVAELGDSILSRAAVRLAVLFVTDSDVSNYRDDLTNPVINRSDGRDMSRRFPDALVRERISKVQASLDSRQTPVFILHLKYLSEGLNEAYQTGLMRLAEASGGATFFCRSQREIPDAVQRALHTIASHHSVELLLPEGASSSFAVNLESPGRSLSFRSRFRK